MDSKEIAQKVVKRKRPDSSVAESPLLNPGDNAKFTLHTMEIGELPDINIDDPVQTKQRVREYFTICSKNDMKPNMAGLALAVGYSRSQLYNLLNLPSKHNKESLDTLKKAAQMLNGMMEDYMQNGKINPVAGIFLMKNNMGYKDAQDIVITPNNPLGEQKDAETLRKKYIESTVVETKD